MCTEQSQSVQSLCTGTDDVLHMVGDGQTAGDSDSEYLQKTTTIRMTSAEMNKDDISMWCNKDIKGSVGVMMSEDTDK